MPWERANAIETTLKWGGLSGLPEGVEIVSVETEGSMFTRTFLLEFNLSREELREWISSSKRLKGKSPVIDKDGTKRYEIYPGEEGSIGGTVRIDPEVGSVKIIMTWS